MSDSIEKDAQFVQKAKIDCKDWKRQAPERLLRIRHVLERVTVSKSLWWSWVASGKAPKGIKLSPKITCWRESEISAFIERLTAQAKQS